MLAGRAGGSVCQGFACPFHLPLACLAPKLKISLQEKELLLREIHHRIKNNMQVISSLLKYQASTLDDHRLEALLKDSQDRINAMSLIHDLLYQSNDLLQISASRYLENLADSIYLSYGLSKEKIELISDVADIPLEVETAIPCGLIVNELITNTLTHAFPDDKHGTITISLHPADEDTLKLIVQDNGIGIPDSLDIRNTQTVGLSLVMNLVEHQLLGHIQVNKSEGTKFQIYFKNLHYKNRI